MFHTCALAQYISNMKRKCVVKTYLNTYWSTESMQMLNICLISQPMYNFTLKHLRVRPAQHKRLTGGYVTGYLLWILHVKRLIEIVRINFLLCLICFILHIISCFYMCSKNLIHSNLVCLELLCICANISSTYPTVRGATRIIVSLANTQFGAHLFWQVKGI